MSEKNNKSSTLMKRIGGSQLDMFAGLTGGIKQNVEVQPNHGSIRTINSRLLHLLQSQDQINFPMTKSASQQKSFKTVQ